MGFDVAGLGNALVDALVVVDDEALLAEFGLIRGTMHPVGHDQWQRVYERIRRHKVTFDSGGSCANSIATVGLLGASAIYCGQVGDDQMGRMYASRMTDACGTHALRFTPDESTGKCLSIISTKDAERTMLTDLGAAISLPSLGDFADVLKTTKIAHFTGYTLLGGPMQEIAMSAMETAFMAGARVSLDAADPFVVTAVKDLLWRLLERYTDIVFLNAEEARVLTGSEPEPAITEIAERGGLSTVVVKLGAEGSLVLHQGDLHRIAAHRVQAIDTTGAGDAYAGGFLFGQVKGWDAKRSGDFASAVAALTVSQVGAVAKDRSVLATLLDREKASA